MSAVGTSLRTLRKAQALKGALRQVDSVTNWFGEGGKSPISSSVGIFVFHHFSASLEPGRCNRRQTHSRKPSVFPAKTGAFSNKSALLPHRHSDERSRLRHCPEATKLRPRCLIDVESDK
jgi:hypothetical protein